MRARALFIAFVATIALAAAAVAGTARTAAAANPNVVEQWNKIAEDTIVGSGAFQNEGLIYMGYVSAAVYDAVTSIQGGYALYGPALPYVPKGASADAAAIEAAYRTLLAYYPSQAATLTPLEQRIIHRTEQLLYGILLIMPLSGFLLCHGGELRGLAFWSLGRSGSADGRDSPIGARGVRNAVAVAARNSSRPGVRSPSRAEGPAHLSNVTGPHDASMSIGLPCQSRTNSTPSSCSSPPTQ